MARIQCTKCQGSGNLPRFEHVAEGVCFECGGTGFVRATPSRVANAKALAGWEPGTLVRLNWRVVTSQGPDIERYKRHAAFFRNALGRIRRVEKRGGRHIATVQFKEHGRNVTETLSLDKLEKV